MSPFCIAEAQSTKKKLRMLSCFSPKLIISLPVLKMKWENSRNEEFIPWIFASCSLMALSSQCPFFSNFHCLLLCHLAHPKVINYQLFSRENNLQCLYLVTLLWDALSFLLHIHEGYLIVFDGKGEMAEPFTNSSLKSVSETWIPLGFVITSFLWVNQDYALLLFGILLVVIFFDISPVQSLIPSPRWMVVVSQQLGEIYRPYFAA